MHAGDAFLLGTDLAGDPARLEPAYDDDAGVTAAFNLNLLAVLNRELGADFDLDGFAHVAVWDREQEWIEMRLQSLRAQTVPPPTELPAPVPRAPVVAASSPDEVEREFAAAGLQLQSWWTAAAGDFAVSLGVPAGALIRLPARNDGRGCRPPASRRTWRSLRPRGWRGPRTSGRWQPRC